MATQTEHYAARLDVDYPESLDRVSTALRIILIIPIAVVRCVRRSLVKLRVAGVARDSELLPLALIEFNHQRLDRLGHVLCLAPSTLGVSGQTSTYTVTGRSLTAREGSRFILDFVESDDVPPDLAEWRVATIRRPWPV